MKFLKHILNFNTHNLNDKYDIDSLKKIQENLNTLSPQVANDIALTSYFMGRVAHSDQEISDDEANVIKTLIVRISGVSEEQAKATVDIIKYQQLFNSGVDDYLVSREFKDSHNKVERENLIKLLFEVACADHIISAEEDLSLKKIADEIGLTNEDYVLIRSQFSHKREIHK